MSYLNPNLQKEIKQNSRRCRTLLKKPALLYVSVSQTVVRGQPVVLKICPCGTSKNTEEKLKYK